MGSFIPSVCCQGNHIWTGTSEARDKRKESGRQEKKGPGHFREPCTVSPSGVIFSKL